MLKSFISKVMKDGEHTHTKKRIHQVLIKDDMAYLLKPYYKRLYIILFLFKLLKRSVVYFFIVCIY